jgi:hypothetical protein
MASGIAISPVLWFLAPHSRLERETHFGTSPTGSARIPREPSTAFTPIARQPSSLSSYEQAAPLGSFVTATVSIGSMKSALGFRDTHDSSVTGEMA